MGITYCPKKRKRGVSDFDVNFSGADLLGYLHNVAGIETVQPMAKGGVLRIKYEATEAQCRKWADKIEKLSDEQKLAACKDAQWGGTTAEFLEWVAEWIKFLRNCRGYESL